jgi:hypothetical protein
MANPHDDDFSRSDLIEKLRHLQVQVGLLSVESHELLIDADAPADEEITSPLDSRDWAAIASASAALASDLQTLIAELDSQ